MEEKELKKEIIRDVEKWEWEVPKLFCLDKGKTENGTTAGSPEASAYTPGAS